MTAEERQRMNSLCQQIAEEKNQRRFLELVCELNDLLQHKQERMAEPAAKLSVD